MDEELRRIPIHQSLHRHNLVFGGERELTLSVGLIAFLVGFGGMTLVSAIAGIAFFVFGLFVLHQMAKSDPLMSKVWMRHISHQDFYDAKASRWRKNYAFKVKK